MSRLIIAALITLLTAPAFAADAQNSVNTKTTEATDAPIKANAKAAEVTAAPNKGNAKTAELPETHKAPATVEQKIAALNKAYYDKAAAEKGTIKTPSGLLYKSLREGSGASPGILSTVKVHFRGTLINNKEFNSSYKRKTPEDHKMNRVFRCWQDGLLKMKVGGKAKLVCPPELAFRGNGAANVVPPNAIVIYEIELLGVK